MALENNIKAVYRLSPLQEGLLFHCLRDDKPGAYFQQYHCRLDDGVDLPRLQQAWHALIAHHDVLRTLFTWENRKQPLQLVRDKVPLPWQWLDWQDQSPEQQQQAWQGVLQRDRERGFDLARAPLMRLTCIDLGQGHYRLLWSFHHLILDGWSQRLLLAQLNRLYHDLPAALGPPDAPRFADYIRWLDLPDAPSATAPGPRSNQAFWRGYLAGFTTPNLPVVTNSHSDNGPSPTGISNHQQLALAPETLTRLRQHATRHRLTLNTLVMGAWALVLRQHARNQQQPGDDVVFGATFAGRPFDLPAIEQTAGLFINTLPVRTRIDEDSPADLWLRQLQKNLLTLQQYQHSSLADIQTWSERPGGQPLFETLVVFENLPGDNQDSPAPPWHSGQYLEYSHYPLAILVVPDQELQLLAIHDPRIFSNDATRRLLAQLHHLLVQLSHSLQVPINALGVIPHNEHHLQRHQWNNTGQRFDDCLAIHQLFEQQARQHPGQLALIDEHQALSYGDLNLRANQLARHLLDNKLLGPGSAHHQTHHQQSPPVAIFLDRGIEAIIAILAVLKTGNAYVPFDPALPPARINQMFDQLGDDQPLVLTRRALRDQLTHAACRVLCLDSEQRTLIKGSGDDLSLHVTPADLAYLIFTSGSTGAPKGVMISHDNLLNATRARGYYGQQQVPLSRFLLMSSLATDSAVAGIFWPLTTGATLVLPPSRIEQQPERLGQFIKDRKISHTLCLPALYQVLLEQSQAEDLKELSAVILAGERCPASLVDAHRQLLPRIRLFNEYGPSEATVWATVADLSHCRARSPAIGKPIANVQIYLLDEQQQPVVIGAPGEIYIGGAGVAQGYWQHPGKTEAVFVDNPFASDDLPAASRQRLYKTGDRGRYRDDGQLEFLGRIDDQFKIRGFRVEPADIEYQLLQHPHITAAAVIRVGSDDVDAESLARQLAELAPQQAEQLLAQATEASEPASTNSQGESYDTTP